MLSKKLNERKLFYDFNIENYIPEDHILRLIKKYIDFSFIYKKVKHLYSHTGKPSIDPIVLFKIILIGYLFNIKSERQLEKDIQVNLAYRWFIDYDIDEKIPDHSVISQTRRRKFCNSNIFQDIFDEIVIQCINKGFIQGSTIITDSTHIKANASIKSLKRIRQIREFCKKYIKGLDKYIIVEKNKITNNKTKKKKFSNKTHRSKSDPDCRLMNRTGKPFGLHYLEHRSVDLSGFITDVFITAGNLNDSEPYIDRLLRQKRALGLKIKNVVADKGYSKYDIYKKLTDLKINAFIPTQEHISTRKNEFSLKDFKYIESDDMYECPEGKYLLRKKARYVSEEKNAIYKGNKEDCINCKSRLKCTQIKGLSPRIILRHKHQKYFDYQLSKLNTAKWKKLLQKRRYIIEGSFGDAKMNHGLNRAKYRGIKKVQEQSFMTAITQNIKKMINKDLKG